MTVEAVSEKRAFEDRLRSERLVVADREMNGYHDSDFYVIYFDPDARTFKRYEYGTTRFPSPTCWGEVNPSPEVAALWEAASRIRDRVYRIEVRNRRLDSIDTGVEVRISNRVRKYKHRRGEVGRFTWVGDSGYGPRVRVEFPDGGSEFFSTNVVEVVARPVKTDSGWVMKPVRKRDAKKAYRRYLRAVGLNGLGA